MIPRSLKFLFWAILLSAPAFADTYHADGCFVLNPKDSCELSEGNWYANGVGHFEITADPVGNHNIWIDYGELVGGSCTFTASTQPFSAGSATDPDREINVPGLLPSTSYCIRVVNDRNGNGSFDTGESIMCTSGTEVVVGFLTCVHWTSGSVAPVLTTLPTHSTWNPVAPTHSHGGLTPPAINNDANVATCAALNTRWDAILSAAEAESVTPTVYGINIQGNLGRCARTGSPYWRIRTTDAEARGHQWVVRCETQTLPAGSTPNSLWPDQCVTLLPNLTDDLTGLGREGNDGFVVGDYCQASPFDNDCPTMWMDGVGISQPNRSESPYVRETINSYSAGTFTLAGDPGLASMQRIAIDGPDDIDCAVDGTWEVSSGDASLTLRDGTPTVNNDGACTSGTITMVPGWALDACSSVSGGLSCTTDDKDGVVTAHGIPDYYALSATLSGATATVTVNPTEGYRNSTQSHVRNGVFVEVTGTGSCNGIYWRSGGTSLAWDLTDAATGSAANFSGCASGTIRKLNGFNVLFTDGTRATFPVRVAGVASNAVEILDPDSRLNSRTPEWLRTAHVGVLGAGLLNLSGGSGHTIQRMLIDGQAPEWRTDNAINLRTAEQSRFNGVHARRYGYMEAWEPITGDGKHEINYNAEQLNRCAFLTQARDIQFTGVACTESWGFGFYNDDPGSGGFTQYSEFLTFKRLVVDNPPWMFANSAESHGFTIQSRGFVLELKDYDGVEIDGAYVRRPGAVFSTPNAGRFVLSQRSSTTLLGRNRDVRFANIQIAQAPASFQVNTDGSANRRHNPTQRFQYHNIATRDIDESVFSVHPNSGFSTSAFGWFFGDFGMGQSFQFSQITALDPQAGEEFWINRRNDRIGRLSISDSIFFLNGLTTVERGAAPDPCFTGSETNQALWDCAYPDGELSSLTVLGCVENGLSGTYAADRAATDQVTATEAEARTPTGTSLSFPGTNTSCDSKEATEFPTAGSWASLSGRGFDPNEYSDAMGLIEGFSGPTAPSSGALRFNYSIDNTEVQAGVLIYACKDSGGSACSSAADFDLEQTRSGTLLDSDLDGSENGARQLDVTGLSAGLVAFFLKADHDFRIGVIQVN